MRYLLSLDKNMKVVADAHILGLAPFRKIWERDKTKAKNKALSELSYIYFMYDYKSYFSDITDIKERHKEVCKTVFEKENVEIDKVVEEAIELYKKDIPLSLGVLEDAKIGINKIRAYFREVDLDERDEKTGKPVHDANKLQNNISKLKGLLDSLRGLEDEVKKDIDTNTTIQGGREKSFFEDPED